MKRPTPLELIAILGIIAVVAAICWPVFPGNKPPSERSICLSNLKQLATGHFMYAGDYDDRFANRDDWMDVLQPYTKSKDEYRCPAFRDQKDPQVYGYCFNAKLSNALMIGDQSTTALVFDSVNLAKNASGSIDSLPIPGRHKTESSDRFNVIAYADGHAEPVKSPAGP